MKQDTISQFNHIDVLAAQNEANNFGFLQAFKDWKSHLEIADKSGHMCNAAFTWFVAGIIVGKKLMLESLKKPTAIVADYPRTPVPYKIIKRR